MGLNFWLSKGINLGEKSYKVGDTCAKRAHILNDLIEEEDKAVYLFKFMKTIRALGKLKADAATAARAYFH
tara:strand:+ start:702 stop:914 length:213 start_codon:yes stop_codon:yes gene_type:complete